MKLQIAALLSAIGTLAAFTFADDATLDKPVSKFKAHKSDSSLKDQINTVRWKTGGCQLDFQGSCYGDCLATARVGCTGITGFLSSLGCSVRPGGTLLTCMCICTV